MNLYPDPSIHLIRIRIQLPKPMRIRIRNPGLHKNKLKSHLVRTVPRIGRIWILIHELQTDLTGTSTFSRSQVWSLLNLLPVLVKDLMERRQNSVDQLSNLNELRRQMLHLGWSCIASPHSASVIQRLRWQILSIHDGHMLCTVPQLISQSSLQNAFFHPIDLIQLLRWRNSADNQRRENTVYFFYFDQLFFTRRAFRNLSSILLYDYTVLSYKTTLSKENICTTSSFCPNYTSGKSYRYVFFFG